MPKSKINFFQTAERLKNVVDEMPVLSSWQLGGIMQRKNTVNGRYVAARNLKSALLGMYEDLLATTPQKQPSPSPLAANTAPTVVEQTSEVAPPVLAVETSRTQSAEVAPPKANQQANQEMPKTMPVLNSKSEQDAFVASAREAVLKAYAGGAAAENSKQSIAKQAQAYQKPEAAQDTQSNSSNGYRLAA